MTSRLAGLLGLVALALASTACTYKTQTQVREAGVDYSDYAHYDRPFAASPNERAEKSPASDAITPSSDDLQGEVAVAESPSKGRGRGSKDLGFGFDAGDSRAPEKVTETETDYEEVEATPGTACYEAAVKAGITNGVCTLVSERKFVLVGQKAR